MEYGKEDFMNQIRRKKIRKAIETLNNVRSVVDQILDEEQDSFDNTPEALQDSEKGDKMQEAISQLEDAVDNIDDAIESLEEASA